MPDAPLTCLDLWCKAGSSTESIGEEGLAHFLEHMVFKGSSGLKAGEFDLQIEALGGSSNAATGFDDVHFHVLVPPKVIEIALELLLKLVLEPALTSETYSLEREVVLEEIAQYKDQPDEQVFQKFLETCWADHSYGRSILGLEESLKRSNPEKMRSFHQRLYRAKNFCLSIAGAIPDQLQKTLNKSKLADLANHIEIETPHINPEKLIFQTTRKQIKISRLESARLLIAWPLSPANDQLNIMGADIATSLLAEGRQSRLVKHLREDLKIVESIDIEVTSLEKGGMILLEACCLEEKVEKVEKEIYKVIQSTVDTALQLEEINRAYQLVKNGLCFSIEAPIQVAGIAGTNTLWDRQQQLLDPIKYIKYWNRDKLQDEILSQLIPENSCTLIATS